MHTHRFNNYPVYICNAMNGMGSNAPAVGRAGGKRDAARLPKDAYRAIREIRKPLEEKGRCEVLVEVFGPEVHLKKYYAWVKVGVGEGAEYKSFRYRRDLPHDVYDAWPVGTEFIELLRQRTGAEIRILEEIHETGHHAWALELHRSPQQAK